MMRTKMERVILRELIKVKKCWDLMHYCKSHASGYVVPYDEYGHIRYENKNDLHV